MISDRYWRRIPTSVQFIVLATTLPGLVAHEYTHAIIGLVEGADSVSFDWGRAQVHINWENENLGVWTWVAPSLIGLILNVLLIVTIILFEWNISMAVLLWVWVQFLLFAFPSAGDIEQMQKAIET